MFLSEIIFIKKVLLYLFFSKELLLGNLVFDKFLLSSIQRDVLIADNCWYVEVIVNL